MNRRGWVGHKPGARVLALAVFAVGTVLLAPALRADDAASRAVRLSYVDGKVQLAQGSQLLADPALQNTPLFEGTQVLTSEEGRAELEFDDGSVVRLSPNSSLTLTVLRGEGSSGETEIELAGGLGYFELQGGGQGGQIRVRFGDSVVTASGFTVLRVNLDNPPGELAVFSGNAHLERAGGAALELHGGQSAIASSSDPSQYILSESIEPNSWDTWNSDRDQELTTVATARTGVANSLPESKNPAWNDLDASGNWYNVPGQGSVWSPYAAASPGWDPYGNGYWMWTPRFGYIWVSGESWGYLPFQCGAWNYFNDFGWGWAPGGCQTWWGGGGGWNFNIGYMPSRYRLPLRPHPIRPHPGDPRGVDTHPLKGGFAGLPGNAIVPVNRGPMRGEDGLSARGRTGIVTIGGHPVEPLRPVMSQRPQYDHITNGPINHSQPAYPGGTMPSGQRPASGFVPGGNHPVYTPPARNPGSTQPVYSPPARAPSGNQNAQPTSRPPSGGGSQPFHPSGGGGGGGGGGGSHSGGGGGGSHGGGGGGNSGGSGHH